jgi:two-component system nitrogen regulation response regulator NtrX
MLEAYDWPGNIRELKNMIERLVIMTPSDTITAKHLLITEQTKQDYLSYKTLKEARDSFEKDFITKRLEENNWNISKTAEILQMERSNLHKKIKAYNIKEL